MNGTRLFLVEDEEAIVRPLTAALERDGFEVHRFAAAEEALQELPERKPDLIVLDIGLPGMSGLDACRIIREKWATPMLILTARGEMIDRVLGLELGADDYMAKPFSSRELVARIRAILRRTGARQERARIVVGEVEVDLDLREVHASGRTVSLTRREFDLLAYLAQHAPAVVQRLELMTEVWDTNWYGSTQTLDVHVAQIRRKLEPDPAHPRFLHTVRGVGYQLRDLQA
jgi:DNA-binding response OmpR family regulator